MKRNKIKEKIVEFWEDHHEDVFNAMILVGGLTLGYGVGHYIARKELGTGLNVCCLIHPEIKDLIQDAHEQARKIGF